MEVFKKLLILVLFLPSICFSDYAADKAKKDEQKKEIKNFLGVGKLNITMLTC